MIKIKNVFKSFGTTEVLRGVNLEIKRGEIIAILGRSGVGKSILLKQIIGLMQPDSGTIEIDPQYKIGMLFQGSALFDSMTIYENTAFYLREHFSLPESEIETKVKYALSIVGLKDVEDFMPSSLSGGMKKRAALARLLVYRPEILLYDEPTTGLDTITANQINELILSTQKELQGTSILVTHDIHSALRLATRIAVLEEGKIDFTDKNHPLIKENN